MKKFNRTLLCLLSGIIIYATQPVLSMEEGDKVTNLQKSIEKTLKELSLRKQEINDEIKNALGSVIIIGHTGTGKSTLLTYLAGSKITVQECDRGFILQ